MPHFVPRPVAAIQGLSFSGRFHNLIRQLDRASTSFDGSLEHLHVVSHQLSSNGIEAVPQNLEPGRVGSARVVDLGWSGDEILALPLRKQPIQDLRPVLD